ncbi:MAG: SDR family oxidoreductase [Rhodospirillaceae bacterium]|nr:SDR family oxidoreductase [Rhodospirillaceae bacterium]
MDLKIAGRHALITGGGRGIGRAIALSLAREGVNTTIVARTQSDLDSLMDEISAHGGNHQGIAMDLVPDGAPQTLLSRIEKSGFSDMDIVVHNMGGTLGITDPYCSIENWRRIYRFNFEIAVELNTLIVPGMQKRGWGRVVHNSSIASMENQGPVTYSAIKAALTAYTRSFGGVVAPDGVVVSAVLPGAIYTDGGYWETASVERADHVEKFLAERQRIGRFGLPEEIANFVAFLCSDLATFNTGSIIPIDGGQGRGYFGQ